MADDFKGIYCAWPSWTESFSELFGEVRSIIKTIPDDAKLVILPGGEDVCPGLYLEESKNSQYTVRRDMLELRILTEALQRKIPVFGVCRGHQLINVAFGGSLIQHLPAEKINHGGGHPLEWLDSPFYEEMAQINLNYVNSLHHQGYDISRCSKSLTPLAVHQGVVEVAIGDGIFSVQFHPEMMSGRVESLKQFILSLYGID